MIRLSLFCDSSLNICVCDGRGMACNFGCFENFMTTWSFLCEIWNLYKKGLCELVFTLISRLILALSLALKIILTNLKQDSC